MTEKIKRIDIKEFREEGFLQEVNRQFFHPLGLALEVLIDDEEGMFFADNMIDEDKIKRVEKLRASKILTRFDAARNYDIYMNENGVQEK